jgi:hypothetical protein
MARWSRLDLDRLVELGREGLPWKDIAADLHRENWHHTAAMFSACSTPEDRAVRRAALPPERRRNGPLARIKLPEPNFSGGFIDDPRAS